MRKSLLLLFLLCAHAGLRAQTLTVPTVKRTAGEVKEVSVTKERGGVIKLELSGSDAHRDLMFSITLPEGITAGEGTSVAGTHIIAYNTIGNTTTFVVYSLIAGALSDGVVVTIPVSVSDTYSGSNTASLESVSITDKEAKESKLANSDFNVRLMLLGDVNDNGEVEIGDATCVVNNVTNNPNDIYVEEVADVNGDEEAGEIGDATSIVNLVVDQPSTTNSSAKRAVINVEDENEVEPD